MKQFFPVIQFSAKGLPDLQYIPVPVEAESKAEAVKKAKEMVRSSYLGAYGLTVSKYLSEEFAPTIVKQWNMVAGT